MEAPYWEVHTMQGPTGIRVYAIDLNGYWSFDVMDQGEQVLILATWEVLPLAITLFKAWLFARLRRKR
jgi:hypothetical protein